MSARTLLFVTRHGQTDANLAKRVQGQGDAPLNATGLAQAHELAEWFRRHPVDRVVSSDLPRARQTAEVLVAALGVPASYHPELRARRMGSYEDKTHAEIEAADPASFQRLKHDPAFAPPDGGESTTQLMERMVPLVRRVAETHPGGRVVILSHHKVCQMIIAELAGGEMRPIPNARPAVVAYEGGVFTLVAEHASHGVA
ncbi:MAG: histidine phosphatase family protein [Nitrospirae bacterium]|nr:histidine phosphatase family protein [Nitrospirota bacterium]